MNEKAKILELTDLVEEDFEEIEGVEDFAPEVAFDATELDSELEMLLDENGKGGGVRDDDIDLEVLFDEEDESGGFVEEDLDAADLTLNNQSSRKGIVAEEMAEVVSDSDAEVVLDLDESEGLESDVMSGEDPFDLFEKIDGAAGAEKKTSLLVGQNSDKNFRKEVREKKVKKETALEPKPAKVVDNQQAETVTALKQDVVELQAKVTVLQDQLAGLNTGLQEKVQADTGTEEQKTESSEALAAVQSLQEQVFTLSSRVQQVEGFAARLQQLEQQAPQNKSEVLAEIQQRQKVLRVRLAKLETAAGEKADVEELRASLKEFIIHEIPTVVAGMLREEIESLSKKIDR